MTRLTVKKIHREQIKLRNAFINKINYFKKKKIDVSKSVLTYGCTWQPNASFFHLKYLIKPSLSRFLKMAYYLLLDLLYTSTLKNFKIGLIKYNKKYNNLILTWGGQNDFDKNGNYFDRKFSSSKNQIKLYGMF